MSSILYYSNYCENCKNLLKIVGKSSIMNSIHFICIDKRIQRQNEIYVILENNQELLLPNTVKCVPALLLINQNYKVIFGNEILTYLKPVEKEIAKKAVNNNGEPSAYSINSPISGIISDNYSFLDQNSDELSAQGQGGMRQLYNYATINHQDKIETPEEDYLPDKVNEDSLKNYETQRNKIN